MKIPTNSLLVFRNTEEVAAAEPVLKHYFSDDEKLVAKILKKNTGIIFHDDGKYTRVPEPYYFDYWKDEYKYVLAFDQRGKLFTRTKPDSITRRSII